MANSFDAMIFPFLPISVSIYVNYVICNSGFRIYNLSDMARFFTDIRDYQLHYHSEIESYHIDDCMNV